MPEKKNILDSVIIMKIKYSRKTNIVLLSVVSTVIMLYTLTFLFGIREVKLGDEAKLHKFYDNANACYRDSGLILLNRLDLFVKQKLEIEKTFPTWEEFKTHEENISTNEYFVIFPFLIKSKHESKYHGDVEYHLWYILGERLLRRNLRWVYCTS